jgi:hypothetical protein
MQACIGQKGHAYKLIVKPEVKEPLKISRRFEENTNVDLK